LFYATPKEMKQTSQPQRSSAPAQQQQAPTGTPASQGK
jgi:hypothetical protein